MAAAYQDLVEEGRWTLPSGWKWMRARDFSRIVGGSTPKNSADPLNYAADGTPWITPADLSGYTRSAIGRGGRSLSATGLASCSARLLPRGAVLISSRAPVGYCAVADVELTTNQGFRSLICDDDIDPFFIRYFVLFARDHLNDRASGTTFKELSGTALGDILFPIPPIECQRRIVARIDELFADIDDGEEELRRAQEELQTYRRSLLKAAVTGKLTSDWRAANAPKETGEELLQRLLDKRRERWKGDPKNAGKQYIPPPSPDLNERMALPDCWTWASWAQVGVSQNGKAFPSSDYSDAGIKLLRPGNLMADGFVRWTEKNTRYLPHTYARENPALMVRGGELIMNLTAQSLADEFLGRVCLTLPGEECLLNQRLARLTVEGVEVSFVCLVLRSSLFRAFVERLNTGSMIQHMYTRQLATFAVPLPPLAEQMEIVRRASAGLSEIEHLERAARNASHTTALRQSVLSAAFRGELMQ